MRAGEPSGEVTIRRSTPWDCAGVRRCLDVVARERIYISMLEAPSVEAVRAFAFGGSEGIVLQWVAERASEIVGWCDVMRKSRPGFTHSAVLGMGLLPAWRGRGLGGRLLCTLIDDARTRDIARIELEVYTTNERAIRLYEHLGFEREGVKRQARILDGRADDILCMALLLRRPRREL